MLRTTKSAVVMSMLLSFILLLGACAPAGQTNSTGSAAPSSNKEQAAATTENVQAKVRSVQGLKGEFKLEQIPQKIVVLDMQYMDQLVALGEQPIASVTGETGQADFPEYLANRISDVAVVGTKEEPNLEAVLAATPDLIIATEFQDKVYDELVEIAPTLVFERNEDWRSVIGKLGILLDKESQAQEVVNKYEARVAELKSKLTEQLNGSTVALIRPRDKAIRLHLVEHRNSEMLYKDLGLTPPEMVRQKGKTSLSISLEMMPELDADHLFLLSDDTNAELSQEYQNTNVWNGLAAVKNNQLYKVNTTKWIAYYGPLAINLVLDDIEEALLK